MGLVLLDEFAEAVPMLLWRWDNDGQRYSEVHKSLQEIAGHTCPEIEEGRTEVGFKEQYCALGRGSLEESIRIAT